ncbi:hypothetical protein KOR34_36570 [Posidoniimonas corsicana]|uniref:Uncharacterized protein n=1 Tax=Posidoniimonas corsicana TaxID=1938618 RepID=A0A5C5V781_9BACT|nr:hypothetical protein [Posidoniimonas corsicana]TWT33823.1 hypothetical protein KOR34_36570 [Posidoniimonas corsicana]
MKCAICNTDAQAVCKFCGRAVCGECASQREYRSGAAPKYFTQTAKSAIIVSNAIWCRQCHVETA